MPKSFLLRLFLYVVLLQIKLASYDVYQNFDQITQKGHERFMVSYYVKREVQCQYNKQKLIQWFKELQLKEINKNTIDAHSIQLVPLYYDCLKTMYSLTESDF